ncbi:MAG: sulfotransferase [Proteobacteria bacterium]|nr:sulfotransferase [Pseudomonadota bacterium]
MYDTPQREKKFILGLGAQRTGSTWLRQQLSRSAQVHLGFCKEYHFFDALFLPAMRSYHDKRNSVDSNVYRELIDKIAVRRAADRSRKLAGFVQDPGRYFDYFDNLWAKNSSVTTVGDFTPSYSMLDHKMFDYARSELERRGFSVKVLFIMRDPVERIWSMRHQAAKVKRMLRDGQDVKNRHFSLESFTYPDAELRTRYERTILELEQVFDTGEVYYDFYERYMTNDRFTMLTDFLDVKCRPPDFGKIVNASYMKDSIDPALAAEAANYYKSTYRFIESRFGNDVRSFWSGYQYITGE